MPRDDTPSGYPRPSWYQRIDWYHVWGLVLLLGISCLFWWILVQLMIGTIAPMPVETRG